MVNIPAVSQDDEHPVDQDCDQRGEPDQGGTPGDPKETIVVELDNDKNSPESEYLDQTVHQIPTDATTPPASTHQS